jgi:HK97 family phage major capsid protein
MKRKAFIGPDAEARYQRAGMWLRATVFESPSAREWCERNMVPVRKAATESMDSAGGFLVPVELSNAIMDLRDMYGAFRRRARVQPMATDTMTVPRHTNGGMTASFFAENTGASAGSFTVDQVQLTARKLGAIVTMSSELEDDALTSMVDYVANELAWAFAVKEDQCAFLGDGTSTYASLVGISKLVLDGNHAQAKVTAASGHNTFANIDQTDLTSLMGAVRASAIPNAAWFCSATAFAQSFCRLSSGSGGGYLYVAEVDGIQTPHYLGFPVILTQALPLVTTTLSGSVMLAFGDMYAGGILGERRGITIARSRDRYLDIDQVAILGTERFDAIIHDAGDNANKGSIAALVGN